MLPDNVEVLYQIGNCYDLLSDFKQAVKWFEMLSSLLPNDPGVLAKLGAIHARFDDEIKALHYYQVGSGESLYSVRHFGLCLTA
jgi:intraflagellar transport protein 88